MSHNEFITATPTRKTNTTTKPNMKKLLISTLVTLGCLSMAGMAWATPYACDVTNSSGIVSFRLNESADNVRVIFGATTNDLGPGLKGLTATNLGIGAGTVKIMVMR